MVKVLYNGNGSTGGNVPVDGATHSPGDTVTVLKNTGSLVRNSDTFAYWNTAANGSGSVEGAGATFVIGLTDVTLFAQWYTTTGLTSGGKTAHAHYQFQYDSALATSGIEPARTNTVIGACENDFTLMKGWFGNIELPYPYPVSILVANFGGGASWGPPITLKGGNGDANFLRDLIVAEVTEMFMFSQGKGWYAADNTNEASNGEGLSHFLNEKFEIGDGRPPGLAFNASLWLNSSLPSGNASSTRIGPAPANYDYGARFDYVNNVLEYDHSNSPASGCSVMFLWYLATQFGFGTAQICQAAAPTLGGVYRNLTGESGDPFPFFKLLLDNAYTQDAVASIPLPNPDDPFPLALGAFWVDKNTFGQSEVQDVLNTHAGKFNNAFWIVIEGFTINRFNALNIGVGAFSGVFAGVPGVSIARSATPIHLEDPAKPNRLQRIRIAFDITFTNGALAAFPATGAPPSVLELDAQITSNGTALRGGVCRTIFELTAGSDPYFTNINPAQNNVFFLSQDLRLFTATPGKNPVPVVGGPSFGGDSTAAAFTYVSDLVNHLNANFADPAGIDPFATLLPGQSEALSGDSSITPVTVDFNFPLFKIYNNYNFALARVRLRGLANDVADNVKVFFRLWSTQTADTDFQPSTTYLSTHVGGHPSAPLLGADNRTIPFFATGNLAANSDYALGGINNRKITLDIGDAKWAYFGCFLNVYDQGNIIAGQPVQALLVGTHHCLVAEIAYDDAPILNSSAVVLSPENSDKLAQRNLQLTASDNPGGAASHRIPQTFDVRASAPLPGVAGGLLDYPDELMIDWGNTPVGAVANIYWPQVASSDVVALAARLYGSNSLAAADAHTIECPVTDGVTYVPIPPGAGESFAGLLTIDLPTTVVVGQEFNVVVRRVTTHRGMQTASRPGPILTILDARPSTEIPGGPDPDDVPEQQPQLTRISSRRLINWRCVIGTFQIRILVATPATILGPERSTLAIFKWRLQQMAPSNRWYPVLERYILYVSSRIRELGGNPDVIPASPLGYWEDPAVQDKPDGESFFGRVVEVLFDCGGRMEGFVLGECCDRNRRFNACDRGLEALVLKACTGGFHVTILADKSHPHTVHQFIVKG